MEVEVKLRLPDAAAHRSLSAYLAPRLLRTDAQRNAFFDAPARPLAAATALARVEEVEEPLDVEAERLRLDGYSQARHYREAEDKLGHGSRCRRRAPPAESYAIGSR
ncbi:hypothetical protein ZWY2020_014074 [Hordeum vulgare]|nr:hypothetical protein ZWY2020_014074 [Hordeum vulgare]